MGRLFNLPFPEKPDWRIFADSRCEEAVSSVWKHITEAAMGARDKEVADLSEDERACIAIVAGIPIQTSGTAQEGNATKFRLTTVPCSIAKIDGKFIVAVQEKDCRPDRVFHTEYPENPFG